jgi:glycosyltransferase involved in cell wall biosynthesis
MQEEAKKYIDKEILLTPFGIDVDRFTPIKINRFFKIDDFVIGTIKTLEKNYGINFLIDAFAIVKKKFPNKSLKLFIVGKGTQREVLEGMAKELGIEKDTIFTGYVDHNNVQEYHNMLDVYVAMSLEESFGVAILEASACGKPVIVSNVGGLPEVVENGKTGFIVERGNSIALADALSKLINEPELAVKMGNEGRYKVIREYDWKDSVNKMISIYKTVIN